MYVPKLLLQFGSAHAYTPINYKRHLISIPNNFISAANNNIDNGNYNNKYNNDNTQAPFLIKRESRLNCGCDNSIFISFPWLLSQTSLSNLYCCLKPRYQTSIVASNLSIKLDVILIVLVI